MLHRMPRHIAQKLDYGIGNTPLEAIILSIQGLPRTVHLKLEGLNPTRSMKDRTAHSIVQTLEDQGKVSRESTIVESTSGNLGVAIARLCRLKGYRFIAIVDSRTTAENLARIQEFGAQVEVVTQQDRHGGYLLSRLARVQSLIKGQMDYIWTNQYDNPANPLIHYNSTGPEIYEQMRGQVDAIFAPVSTGGTLAGIGRFFRMILPATRIIGVDAYGSVVFGGPPAPRKLTGIGSSRRSTFLHEKLYDEHMLIKDQEAFAFCRFLFAATGIKVGGSSGAVLAACARYLSWHRELEHVVCVCADHGDNYNSSIFSDTWLQEQGFELSATHPGNVEQIRHTNTNKL
jgi:N-(2-amino-2-carboxyethyl)-L-glutamate synthase